MEVSWWVLTYLQDSRTEFLQNGNRSNISEVFCEKAVPKKFSKFTLKHLLLSYYTKPATLLKKWLRHKCFCFDLIYDQPNNESLCHQIESVQYNASLAITGAIKGTSRLKLYSEIGLEPLKFKRWFRKLCTFCKIKSTGLSSYLYDLIPKSSHIYNTASIEDVAMLYNRTYIFKYSFSLSTISEWNKLDLKIWQSKTFLTFWNALIKIGSPFLSQFIMYITLLL